MPRQLERSAEEFLPEDHSLNALRKAARACQGCDLYENATQTVFGEGPVDARVLFVGEQPGDVEDTTGRPFVGPAGKLFDREARHLQYAAFAKDLEVVAGVLRRRSGR